MHALLAFCHSSCSFLLYLKRNLQVSDNSAPIVQVATTPVQPVVQQVDFWATIDPHNVQAEPVRPFRKGMTATVIVSQRELMCVVFFHSQDLQSSHFIFGRVWRWQAASVCGACICRLFAFFSIAQTSPLLLFLSYELCYSNSMPESLFCCESNE